jgi:2,3-dihydroxybenzoate decarboxylase
MAGHFTGTEAGRPGETPRLLDLGALRIKEMDEAGIIQVVSHGAPAAQKIPADIAVPLTRGSTIACMRRSPRIPASPPSRRCRPTTPPRPPRSNAASPRSASKARCCTVSRTGNSSTTGGSG